MAKARRWARLGAFGLLAALVGGVVGAVVALTTPAHVEIAGSNTRVRLAVGSTVDQFGVPGLVTIKRATSRSVFGEPLGVRAVLDLNVAQLVNATGQFNPDVLPAYIQAYSDPKQL
ncbi:MAG: putative phosphohydrolase, superfamily, partial [Jatrophihabitans sp.]|nr:putative phosphohydrolase, superfamily [Jatrophihabitans sp.]